MKGKSFFVATSIFASSVAWADLRLGTWNIEWLDSQSPRYESTRSKADYDKLATIFNETGIDILSFQEVGNEEALRKVVGSGYHIEMSNRAVKHITVQPKPLWRQYTGFVIKDGISYKRHPDLDLDIEQENRMRHAVDITIFKDGKEYARLLSIHLKSGCFSQAQNECFVLDKQSERLADWIEKREAEGVPYFILGDLNRRITSNSDRWFIRALEQGKYQLNSASDTKHSECWSRKYDYHEKNEILIRYPEYIDHIVYGKSGESLVIPGTFNQTIASIEDIAKYKLSDHCSISINISY